MRAMVLAAGLGTRLRPLTDTRPKALVEVGGRTLLQIVLERLRGFGVGEVIVNVHHFAGMIVEHLETHHNFGMRVEVSHEPNLLDTGGGLRKAAWFFLDDPDRRDEPFLLHNVDVISTIDLARMRQFHLEQQALATLAVQERRTSRYLLFDRRGELCGKAGTGGRSELVRPADDPGPLGFCGIHVISPRLLETMTREGAFSIIDAYLELAARDRRILAFRADGCSWRDLGDPASLALAEKEWS